MLSNNLFKRLINPLSIRAFAGTPKKPIFGRKPVGEHAQEGETPFFGTGFEQGQYLREKEAAEHKLGQVRSEESIPSEEKMENPEEFEGFENEEEKRSSKYRSRYSAEEQNGGKTRGQ